MRTHVEFRSDAFPAEPDEDVAVNPGLFGRRLARWLRGALAEHGVPAGEPFAEDWGWVVPVADSPFPMWVGCGNYEEYPDGFLCFVHPHRPRIRRGLRRVETRAEVERVAAALDAALRGHPAIREIRWWAAGEVP